MIKNFELQSKIFLLNSQNIIVTFIILVDL